MITEIDFSKYTRFPGEVGNVFDVLLHKAEGIDRLPHWLFAGVLFLVALLPTQANWPYTILLYIFFLLDWLSLALLPVRGRSFGPPKPPVLILAVLRAVFAWLPPPVWIPLQIIGTGLVIYGFWIEPHRLTVTHQTLKTPKLKSGTRLRLLHLGDLHIERATRREEELNCQVKALQPDLIVFTGDVLNLSYLQDRISWNQARQVMSEWSAPQGVYLVTGSPAVDLAGNMPELLAGLPLRWLKDEHISVPVGDECLNLVGVTCTHRPFLDGPRLEETCQGLPDDFTVLLYHSPDLAPIASRLPIDLQLSGHTHGGQVRLPWFGALFTGSLYGRAFQSGRYQLDRLTLYISRGIGMEGASAPRVRFLCPPEIILWEIEGTGQV
ncbi:MAG: hypothetical protein VB089_17405 [Anaerolineaceae bacterium]|nr:hypothetical protein [Anaerolineaceae bacterium]